MPGRSPVDVVHMKRLRDYDTDIVDYRAPANSQPNAKLRDPGQKRTVSGLALRYAGPGIVAYFIVRAILRYYVQSGGF